MEAAYGQFERRLPVPDGVDEKNDRHRVLGQDPRGRRPEGREGLEAPTARAIPVKSSKVVQTAKAA